MQRTVARETSEARSVSHYPRAGLHGRIVHDIGRLIVTGAIGPGELVPAASRVGASRGVMREAIKVLAAKGLVASRQRTGTRVRPRDEWNLLDPDVLAWRQEGLQGQHLLGRLTEVRLIIEPAAAELAARRAGPERVRQIQAALRDMRDALDRIPPDHEAYNDADIRFHRGVVQACDNEILEQMGAVVTRALLVAFNTAVRVPGLARGSLERHQAIVDAIRRGQARRARMAMNALVQNTGRAIAKLPRGRAPKKPTRKG
jgi:GntR family transcriptional regulator, galactonate operon transcriptional repressor